MSALMDTPTTVRLVVQVKAETHATLKAEAYLRGVDMGELVDALVAQALPETLASVRERRRDAKRKSN